MRRVNITKERLFQRKKKEYQHQNHERSDRTVEKHGETKRQIRENSKQSTASILTHRRGEKVNITTTGKVRQS
jgi:hypothetical protein